MLKEAQENATWRTSFESAMAVMAYLNTLLPEPARGWGEVKLRATGTSERDGWIVEAEDGNGRHFYGSFFPDHMAHHMAEQLAELTDQPGPNAVKAEKARAEECSS
jgi:hypothetical protein